MSSKRKEKERERQQIERERLIEFKKHITPINNNKSDIIIRNILEKIISLTITNSARNQVEKKIPDFCFEEITQSFELAINLDCLNYDKDDMKPGKKVKNSKIKSEKKILKLKKEDDPPDNEEQILVKNKSEKLIKYKFHKQLDPNFSLENSINLDVFNTPKKTKEKGKNKTRRNDKKDRDKKDKGQEKEFSVKNLLLLNGLIIRDNEVENAKIKEEEKKVEKESEDSFIISPQKDMGNNDPIKIEDNIKFYSIFKNQTFAKNELAFGRIKKGKNHWDTIEQPTVPTIDRDAGTKIRYEKPIFKFPVTKEMTSGEINKNSKEDKKRKESEKEIKKNNTPKSKKKLKLFKSSYEEEVERSKSKKRFAPILEFKSENLDSKLFENENETKELQKLRDDLEKEIQDKKIEKANLLRKEKERLALEKAREEKRKELANKNVTVDVKGELIYIKSLDINKFINDFTKSKSKFKEVKTVESELNMSLKPKRRADVVVEKNPDNNNDFQEQEKMQKKGRGKKTRRKSFVGDDKLQHQYSKTQQGFSFFDKSKEPIIGSGSNFDIMNPSCGVNLTENKKTKSGGKDFFNKYNKFSIKAFEETLNRTISSNFYQNNMTTNFLNINNNVTSLKKKAIKEKTLGLNNPEKELEKKTKPVSKKNNINLSASNELNQQMKVKAKNLKLALKNLDLITEGELRYLSGSGNKLHKSKDIIKRKQFIIDFDKKEKKDYEEIDSFAKTLLGIKNWGDNLISKTKLRKHFRIPKKPVYDDLKKEVPMTLLNRLPRKRLPPINVINKLKENDFSKTMSEGFLIHNRKKNKNKLKPISMEENKTTQIETETDNNKNKKSNNNSKSYKI